MKCPVCGSENPDDAKICLGCGKAIEWWRIRVTGSVGKLNPSVLAALDAIPKAHRMKIPADATLTDGRRFPCTLFLEASDGTSEEYFSPVGMLRPNYSLDEKTRRRVIMPEMVLSVTESPYRTPIALEEKMYHEEFREVFMSAPFMCKLVLVDGEEYLMVREDWDTEFIVLPDNIPNSRISDVLRVSLIDDRSRLTDANRELPDPGVKYCMFTR